jgi:hypothetical protein
MNNSVFWVIKSQFVPHRRHNISTTVSNRLIYVRFEVFTAVPMKRSKSKLSYH